MYHKKSNYKNCVYLFEFFSEKFRQSTILFAYLLFDDWLKIH